MIHNSKVEQLLAQNATRLRTCLQHVSGDSYGPEEGSDAWLLLHALIGDDNPALLDRFEQSGRWLATQGGKLDTRIQGLQRYIDALALEIRDLFSQISLPNEEERTTLLVEATSRLYQLQSCCVLVLTRGYQHVMDQTSEERHVHSQQLEQRFLALQRINGVSNSTMDLDQTLEIITKVVAEELKVDLCTIFFYDELQRMLTLRATNGPRPLGGMHFTLRLGEGYSGWVADKGRPMVVHDAMTDANFAGEAHAYTTEYHGLMVLPIIFFGNDERLIGVISVQSSEVRDFTRDEVSFVEVVAGIVAISIEN